MSISLLKKTCEFFQSDEFKVPLNNILQAGFVCSVIKTLGFTKLPIIPLGNLKREKLRTGHKPPSNHRRGYSTLPHSDVWYRLGRNRTTRHPPRTMLTRASSRLSDAAIGAGPAAEVAAIASLAFITFARIQTENTTTNTLNNVQFTSSLQSR